MIAIDGTILYAESCAIGLQGGTEQIILMNQATESHSKDHDCTKLCCNRCSNWIGTDRVTDGPILEHHGSFYAIVPSRGEDMGSDWKILTPPYKATSPTHTHLQQKWLLCHSTAWALTSYIRSVCISHHTGNSQFHRVWEANLTVMSILGQNITHVQDR